jgi:hypothetical protein
MEYILCEVSCVTPNCKMSHAPNRLYIHPPGEGSEGVVCGGCGNKIDQENIAYLSEPMSELECSLQPRIETIGGNLPRRKNSQ